MRPRENFHSKIFEASFYTFQIFRIKNEVSVTTTKIFFQVWQNCKQSLEEQSKKKLVSKEKKILIFFFQVFNEVFFKF